MGRYITVSAKVRKELLEEAKRLGINVSEFIRRSLEEEVRRRRLMELEESLRRMHGILDKIDMDEIVELIRKDREAR